MYGMGFDGADDALDVLAAAAGAPAPAAAGAAAGGAPVQAHGHAVHEFALCHVGGVGSLWPWRACRGRGDDDGVRQGKAATRASIARAVVTIPRDSITCMHGA